MDQPGTNVRDYAQKPEKFRSDFTHPRLTASEQLFRTFPPLTWCNFRAASHTRITVTLALPVATA